MIRQEDREDLLSELESFISSDFSSMDLVNFILDNKLAQDLLRKITYYEYDKELNYINSTDLSTIEFVLGKHHNEFYDPYYGSEDPLMSFRLTKEDIEGCETLDDLREFDNILSHLLDQLELEPLEVDKEELLCKENLEKLVKGKIDCSVDQIYFFEKVSDFFEFNFHYYFRDNNSSWCCKICECDVHEFDTIVDITKYDNICEAFEAYIAYFSNIFRNEYSQNITTTELGCSLFFKYINSSLENNVYNGLNAINQLREFVSKSFLFCWCHLQEDKLKEIDELKRSWLDTMEQHKSTLNSSQRDGYGYNSIVRTIKEAKASEIWSMNKCFHTITDLVAAIEKENKEIEQLREKIHELNVHLKYERSKNEVLEFELMKKMDE